MRITVLGKSPAWQDVDGACSGYLVEEQGCRLLVDCGNGVFSKLRRYRDYREMLFRSEAMRDIVREMVERDRLAEPDTDCIGALTFVFDHETRDLAQVGAVEPGGPQPQELGHPDRAHSDP